MVSIKKIVLDILKPHQPNVLEFSQAIAEVGSDYQVHLVVLGVDENTETIQLEVQGSSIDFDSIQTAINNLGGSLHSIDEAEVHSEIESD